MIPKLTDSNASGVHRATFFVCAASATPSTCFESTPDSGYSVDNLAPAPPAPFVAAYVGGATHLHWGANTEHDLSSYHLYRGTSAGLVPAPANLVANLADTGFVDVGPAGRHYKLSAVDANGNEGAFTSLLPGGSSAAPDAAGVVFAPERALPPGLYLMCLTQGARQGIARVAVIE